MAAEFTIYRLAVAGGQVAIAPMPGRGGDLAADLKLISEWSPGLVISMTTDTEMSLAEDRTLGPHICSLGLRWHHVPVADFGTPEQAALARWAVAADAARAVLPDGGRVLIHCMGGCGRSGMAALRLMAEAGEDPDAALSRLRAVRACAVETEAQLAWAVAGDKLGATGTKRRRR